MPRPNRRSEVHQAILELLRRRPSTRLEMTEHVNLASRTLDRVLGDLRAQGYPIVSVCEGRTWRYRLESSPVETS